MELCSIRSELTIGYYCANMVVVQCSVKCVLVIRTPNQLRTLLHLRGNGPLVFVVALKIPLIVRKFSICFISNEEKKKKKIYQNSIFNIWGATCIICKFPCWSVPKFSKNYMKCAILFSNININLEHLTTTNQSKKEKTRCKYLLTNSIVFFPLKVGLPVAVPSSPLAVLQRQWTRDEHVIKQILLIVL